MKGRKRNAQKQLGPLVSGLLKRRAHSQTEVAAKVGMSAPQICNFLNGKTDIHASRLVEILEALGIDLLRLIRIETGLDVESDGENRMRYSSLPEIERSTLKRFFDVYTERLQRDSRNA
jgi:transcriptional regulator with XRE-family HTH domain